MGTRSYQIKSEQHLRANIEDCLKYNEYLMDESNHTEENGKEILNAIEEYNINNDEAFQINSITKWFDTYFTLKDNLEQYAPNMADYALKKHLKENPISNAMFPAFDGNSFEHNKQYVFKLFEEIYAEDVIKELNLKEHIKENFKKTITDILEDPALTYSISTSSGCFLTTSLHTDFYKKQLGVDIIEIVTQSPKSVYQLSLSVDYINEQFINDKKPDTSKPLIKAFYEFEKIYEEINNNRIQTDEDFLRGLNVKEKSQLFNVSQKVSKYADKYENAVKFIKQAYYVPNQKETSDILNGLKFNPNKVVLEEYLKVLIDKTKLDCVMHKKNPKNNEDTKDIGQEFNQI